MPRLAVIASVLLLLLMLILAAPAVAERPYAIPTPVATGIGTQSSPSLSGSDVEQGVSWEDDANGQWDVFRSFRLVDILVPAGTSAQRHPAGEGYTVVYEDDRAGNWDIFAYDTSLVDPYGPPSETQVTSGVADQCDPAIDAATVVFEDKTRGNWDIAVYDVAASTGRFLTANSASQVDPAIDRGKVVFADRRNGNWDIYCYDLVKKSLKRLTTNSAAQTNPQIGDGIVVYQDHRNGNWDVYSYDLSTRKERRLTTDQHDQTAPAVGDGRSVVYEDDRAGEPDVWLCDLNTGINCRVTDAPQGQTEPCVVGTNVAWRDEQADAGDVFRCALQYPDLSLGWDGASTSTPPPPYDSTLRFEGFLQVGYGSVQGLQVTVSGSGGTRKVDVVPSSETVGRFAVTLRHVVRKVTLRALFRGSAAYLPDNAAPVSVKPTALLPRPSFTLLPMPSGIVPYGSRDCVVSGYLKPHHRAGTTAVKIQCWVYVSLVPQGEEPYWKLDKTVGVRIKDSGSYSSYRAKIHLDGRIGRSKWKVRVVHADADHAKTVSSYSASRNL